MMRVLVVQVVSEEVLVGSPFVSAAGNKFNNKLIECIKPDIVISLVPVFIQNSISLKNIKTVQVRLVPQTGVGKLLNTFLENCQLMVTLLKYPTTVNIWFYNLTPHNVLAFLMLTILKRKVFLLLADIDPPSTRRPLSSLIVYLAGKAQGVISLAAGTANIIKNRNFAVLSGIVSDSEISVNKRPLNRKTILFSGALNRYNGVELLLDTFSHLPEFELVVTGRGELQDRVIAYSKGRRNIRFLGFVTEENYLNLISKLDICLSLRNPNIGANSYNFPSKILEYLAKGKIVISTVMYPSIDKQLYFYSPYEKYCLIKTIRKVASMSQEKYEYHQKAAAEFAKTEFGYFNWQTTFNNVEQAKI